MSLLGSGLLGSSVLCQIPAGTAPEGVRPNFDDPPTYAPAVIAVTAIVLFFATLFTGCRLLANWRKLTWSDHLNTLALIFSIGQSGIMLAQLKFVRHQWDIPACWFFGNYAKLIFSQQMMLTPGLIFSKASLFLLFLQIFDTSIRGGMKLAIRIGLVATVIVYLPALPIMAYFQAPGAGESWEGVMTSGKPQRAIYWGIVQSVLGIILDLYMFVLPLPVIIRLHISKAKRIQLGLVFSTAFMGVVANVLSLVYRIIEFQHLEDATWNLYALLLCTVVELNIAIIVCSVPGLSKFFRFYAATWSPIQSLWSKFSTPGNSSNASGSYPRKNHGWPAAHQAVPNSRTDVEAGIKQSTLISSNNSGVDRAHDYIELEDRWEVDPYLDTAGPEYAWMHSEPENHENEIAEGSSPRQKAAGFQSVRVG